MSTQKSHKTRKKEGGDGNDGDNNNWIQRMRTRRRLVTQLFLAREFCVTFESKEGGKAG